MTLNRDALMADLIRDEGLKLNPYLCTAGKMTIGVGRNLDDRGITRDEALYMLGNDITITMKDLDAVIPEWRYLDEPKARALANMCFQLGRVRFCQFTKMIAAIRKHDFAEAGREARDSLWYKQVPNRAERVIKMLEAE
jgi:lysozyme